jgi:mRNA interferase RelE/StbE
MLYRIDYDEEVFSQLAKIPRNVRETIMVAIEERLSVNPFRFKYFSGELKRYYRLRIGDYRVIYHILNKEVTVLTVKIGTRGNVYKN